MVFETIPAAIEFAQPLTYSPVVLICVSIPIMMPTGRVNAKITAKTAFQALLRIVSDIAVPSEIPDHAATE